VGLACSISAGAAAAAVFTVSLHDALPICGLYRCSLCVGCCGDEGIKCFYRSADNEYGTDIRYYFGHAYFWTTGNDELRLLYGSCYYSRSGVLVSLCENQDRKPGEKAYQSEIALINNEAGHCPASLF